MSESPKPQQPRKKRKIMEITTNNLQSATPELNKKIMDILKEVGEFERVSNNLIKSRVYARAVKVIQTLDHDLTSGAEAQKFDGIGKKIGKKIDEIIATGELKKLKKYQEDEDLQSLRLLQRVTGIGPAAAQKFVKEGIRTINDLRTKAKLNNHQNIGLKYFDEFEERIPRDEVMEIEEIVIDAIQKIDKQILGKVCGSYRRGSSSSGDVDILLTHPNYHSNSKDDKVLDRIVASLKNSGFLTDHISHGKTKYMGVCQIDATHLHRRIDLCMIPYENFWCGLLYFTGSDFFNQQMRTISLEKGFTLNEYQICPIGETGVKGEPIEVLSEEDIFDIIDMKYKTPAERNL